LGELDENVEKVLAGDLDEYSAIVEACESRVRAVVAAMVPDPNRVPDATQEVFIVAFRRLSSYRRGSNFMAWIRTIARNVARNERRRWYRRREMEQSHATEVARSIEDSINRVVDGLPEDVLASLHDCMDHLGGKTRRLVNGFYYDRSSIRDLADVLKVSANAAKVTLHRARHAIGKCLREKGQCRA